jgi:hypothetical protein
MPRTRAVMPSRTSYETVVMTGLTALLNQRRARHGPRPRPGAVQAGCYSVTYIVWNVGMPRTLSLNMPPILEPRMIAVPA